MAIQVVRLGDPRGRGEGILFGTIRFQPMFTVKEDMPYDVWLPELAPSRELLKKFRDSDTMTWELFKRKYRSEMKEPTPKHLIKMLVVLSREIDLSISCFCEDESSCHRSILRDLLADAGAAMD